MSVKIKEIVYYGAKCTLVCDGNCNDAWGVTSRPRVYLSESDPDDFYYLPDGDLDEAPLDPGTYEGGCGKPTCVSEGEQMNKWCTRECERSTFLAGHNLTLLVGDALKACPDFSKRVYNYTERQKEYDAQQKGKE